MIDFTNEEIEDYWNLYYDKKLDRLPNSDFASFIINKIETEKSLIDIGCGDARDSYFFSINNIFTTGIDISSAVIKKNSLLENKYLKFEEMDLSEINKHKAIYDFAYCRFLFHAIPEHIENELLSWLKNNIKSQIFIETRILDEMDKSISTSHFRRFFTSESFIEKLVKSNFKIVYKKTSYNFSKYKSIYGVKDLQKDPLILRLIIE